MENTGRIVSCCGVVCTNCRFYPGECPGCPALEGKVFWLAYTGESICPIYRCCVVEKGLAHCGRCEALPCAHYEQGDPTLTQAENEAIFREQMRVLRAMATEDADA